MTQDRPTSVVVAVRLTGALVALSGITALLSVVFKDELMDAWRSGRDDAGSVQAPAIVPVAVVMLVVFALVALVLLQFFRSGHGWARVALTVTVVVMAISTLATLRIGPPTLFVVLSVLGVLIQLGVVAALWHRDTAAYLRAHEIAEDLHTGS
ncbi:hypothetical protein ASC77_03400 [Nocardioides sp. Root1257]|uniref:hypothetical protein n=1 Tax=unclassified Nocardioides TaxID=2615069 RepID=UPI0006F1FF5A|nr:MULTISPECIES: hypothetical protein [unclassified Nocardioides]KQW53341.1 hypothetical protein ASC77_03400 [Nocardioides sp. Root1257]KRC56027.1 hypothetical protein ASE24_03400 [Nocardioides sp. Root224]